MVTGANIREFVVEDVPWSVFERDPLTTLIDGQAGVIARWQALQFLSRKAIEHRITTRRWRRVHRGVYLAYGGPVTLAQRYWIAVLAGGSGPSLLDSDAPCLAGLSALQVHGLQRITSTQIDIVVPTARRLLAPPGVVVHRSVEIDRHPASRPPSTTIGRAVVDAAAWARSDEQARLVIVASFQQRLVTGPEILPVLDRLQNIPRHRLIVLTVNEASGGSHTLGELALIRICRSERLPLPDRQLCIPDLSGRLRFLDAVFDRWRVAVEIDGAHHDEVPQRWDDDERDNSLIFATYRVLRYPAHIVRTQPKRVAAQLRLALIAAGWNPEDP